MLSVPGELSVRSFVWSVGRTFRMSSLLLAVGRATFVWWAGGTFNVVFAIGTTLPTSTFRHFCGRPRLMSSSAGGTPHFCGQPVF